MTCHLHQNQPEANLHVQMCVPALGDLVVLCMAARWASQNGLELASS